MSMENIELRDIVYKTNLKYKTIAAKMDITPEYLSRCLRYELKPEMRDRILAAINQLRGEAEEEMNAREGGEMKNEWISVKDRLPTKSGFYFVIRDNGFMQVSYFTNRSHWGKSVCKITHWMSLPEAPKEGEAG